ncbi:MAG TPA: hypothetical protein VK158_03610 [Acidobacteriota bacterium]|nr:hypothetical protein [Acidobacteriota bacterium]
MAKIPITSDMNRAQIEKQIRIFKKRKFPVSDNRFIAEAIHSGSADFAEYTQWERAFLEHSMTPHDVIAITKWLPSTNNYIVFAKLRKIAVSTPHERRDWTYTHAFFTTMIQLTKAILTHSVTHKKL